MLARIGKALESVGGASRLDGSLDARGELLDVRNKLSLQLRLKLAEERLRLADARIEPLWGRDEFPCRGRLKDEPLSRQRSYSSHRDCSTRAS